MNTPQQEDMESSLREARKEGVTERRRANFAALKKFWAGNPNIRTRPGVLTDLQRSAIADAIKSGGNRYLDIAADYLVCEARIAGIAKEMGCARSTLREARDQQILKRLDTGALYKDVAREFGLTMKCVAKVARRNGIIRLKRVSPICAGEKTHAKVKGCLRSSGQFLPREAIEEQTRSMRMDGKVIKDTPTGGGVKPSSPVLSPAQRSSNPQQEDRG